MSLHCETGHDTHLLLVLGRHGRERTQGNEDASTSPSLPPGPQPPELFSRRIDAKKLVVSHLDIFLEAADQYLQEYGTTHNFGRDLHKCLEVLCSLRANLQAP
jgi:hypothetical protein